MSEIAKTAWLANIETWLSDPEGSKLLAADYWNDEGEEDGKEWNVLDGDFSRMESYLQEMGLPDDMKCCAAVLAKYGRGLSGVGIDLAAGTMWAAPHLLALGNISKLYCLEYSRHRLLRLGPWVLEHYNVPKEKVRLVYGSFYDLRLKDHSVDFVFLSQAFHHAEKPLDLLAEIRRVLKPEGAVTIIGEHEVNLPAWYAKHIAKSIFLTAFPAKAQRAIFGRELHLHRRAKAIIPTPAELCAPDPVLGDHYYTPRQYQSMFIRAGFRSIPVAKRRGAQFLSFVLFPGDAG